MVESESSGFSLGERSYKKERGQEGVNSVGWVGGGISVINAVIHGVSVKVNTYRNVRMCVYIHVFPTLLPRAPRM